jgi:nucleoside-diphosphate-sugar epimerase
MMLSGQPVPVHPQGPSRFNPIHEVDIIAMLPKLLAAASVPATIVNWGGDEETSIEEWCTYMADLAGCEARFDVTEHTIGGIPTDNTRRRELAGPTTVGWKDGMRELVEQRLAGSHSL